MATTVPRSSPLTDPVDALLADVAIRIQLSQTDYDRAVDRYRAIRNWIERDDSPLKDDVKLFYPQGSMAVGATIASKLGTDEFDIDVVAQLDLLENEPPKQALNLLYQAIRGEPGSRYHRMTKRKTRCITVQYEDGMHVDVTPAVRLLDTPERESVIFHQRPEEPHDSGYTRVANPYGFAEWFNDKTQPDDAFADVFEARARKYLQVFARADSDPIPPQEPPSRKSKAVIALQLLKRWRNVQYDARPGRRPPSIMIAKLVADAANHTDRLSEELLHQSRHMLSVFHQQVDSSGRLLPISNPVCRRDILTDRWPESKQDQGLFIHDLDVLVENVERLVSGCDMEEMQRLMVELFGEKPAVDAFWAFNKRIGDDVRSGRSRHQPDLGGLVIPGAAAGIGASSASRATPSHRFFGGE